MLIETVAVLVGRSEGPGLHCALSSVAKETRVLYPFSSRSIRSGAVAALRAKGSARREGASQRPLGGCCGDCRPAGQRSASLPASKQA